MPLLPRDHTAPSVFRPEALLREARRQRCLPATPVPPICLLDPDGDVARHLLATGLGVRNAAWACYHSEMVLSDAGVGVVPCAVGAPYAVLVAEQLYASGCELLVSVTSAGRIVPLGEPPYFVLIERALRDEGTSGHYLPPAEWAALAPTLAARLAPLDVLRGSSWTTDAPFRETAAAIAAAEARGIACVEMEAAALYAFAEARCRPVVCLAHVTNVMATVEGDFEKGAADGASATLALVAAIARLARG